MIFNYYKIMYMHVVSYIRLIEDVRVFYAICPPVFHTICTGVLCNMYRCQSVTD
jgi:hypothetical protein